MSQAQRDVERQFGTASVPSLACASVGKVSVSTKTNVGVSAQELSVQCKQGQTGSPQVQGYLGKESC